ncbi:ATP-binding protein [Peteryoungia ipomoeae]|uniref:ATP-dependent DNA helicase RecG n=1 Tax=Peteryoungia ipomoeae TaxID=1210932 RepID=A0A4S8P6Q5_9HYPH|nr:ATP-binding protein [Peteryoungia ipomoeae]THV25101.1 ATP-dependent DNA helicase RecG [Peteryoungia ipomoeae]
MVDTKFIESAELSLLLGVNESHFVDLKAKALSPAKFTRTISAFANASGGEIFVGIEEIGGVEGKERIWDGFVDQEEANSFFQVMHNLDPLGKDFSFEWLASREEKGLVLHVTVQKTQEIFLATDGKAYIRNNAQNLPVREDALEKLKYDKGIKTYEDERLQVDTSEITNSEAIIEFLLETIPTGEPDAWLKKQFVIVDDRPTVAGVLLYSDSPQAILPKRSAVKILRYQTKTDAERDFLAEDPETIEGPLYSLIYDSVDRIKEIIERLEKVGPSGMERIVYPEEAVHELITNAVLHRDYSIAADVQVRIFDNRVEIESPGKLPGHVTVENISRTQFARNPKIVRLINKYRNPPNKDVGEGVNTAFEAMEKLRLKKPQFVETDSSVIVTLRHETLASPESLVLEYLNDNDEITNQIARDLTGIKSENTMKNVFYRLRETGQLEQVPKTKGKKHAWRKPAAP